jgi:hypothetical protein
MQRFNDCRASDPGGDAQKHPYSCPKLVRYGDLRELTQGGAGTLQDGGGGAKTKSSGGG